jgi:hypothetical protein
MGLVADSKAYSQRPVGLWGEQQMGLVTLDPRPCAVRQAGTAWGQPRLPVPLGGEKPGRTQGDASQRWWGQSGERSVDVESADGPVGQEQRRFLVGHSRQLTPQPIPAYTTAQPQEAERVAAHLRRVEAQHFASVADTEVAIAECAGRGQGRRGRRPRLWRYHSLRSRVAACTQRRKRARRGRPAQGEGA